MCDYATIRAAVSAFNSRELRAARRALEEEAINWARCGVRTQSLVGKLELLGAIGAELDERRELLEPPPFIDLCCEDGVRYSMQVRVF